MPDDFDPDIHAPIVRTRCLATAWFDEDPAPAVCVLAPGHVDEHRAAVQARTVTPAWEQTDEIGDVA